MIAENARKRALLAAVVALLVAIVVAGCGGDDGNEGDAADGPVTLTYWTMLDHNAEDPRSAAERDVVEQFMKDNPDIKVEVQSFAWNELPQKTVLAVAAGQGPDVARVSFGQSLEYVQQDTLEPLDATLTDADKQDLLGEKAVFDEKWLGVVWSPVPNGILYRKDLFKATGKPEPKTWDELADVLEAMTTKDVAGLGFGLKPGEDLLYTYFLPYVWGEGDQAFDDSDQAKFDSPSGVAAFEYLVDLIKQRRAMPESVANMGANEVLDGFRAGKYAAVIDSASRVTYAEDSDVTKGKVGLWRFPSSSGKDAPPFVLSWFIGVMQTSKHKEAAQKLAKFMASADADAIKAEVSGELPSRASSLDDKWFDEKGSSVEGDFFAYLKDHQDSPQRHVPKPELFHDALIQAMQSVLAGNASIPDALRKASDEYNAGT